MSLSDIHLMLVDIGGIIGLRQKAIVVSVTKEEIGILCMSTAACGEGRSKKVHSHAMSRDDVYLV